MVTADPLAPMPSDPGDRPGAISGFALILSLPQPGNCQGPKYRGPTSSRAGPSRQVVRGRRSGRGDQPRGLISAEGMGQGTGPNSWPGTTIGPGSFSVAFAHS